MIWEKVSTSGIESEKFLRKQWFSAWQKKLDESKNWSGPLSYLENDENEFSVIFPMATQVKGPLRFASLAGNWLPFRGIPYCGDEKKVSVAVNKHLSNIKNITGLKIGPINGSAPLSGYLIDELKKEWKVLIKEIDFLYSLKLPDSIDKLNEIISSQRQKKVRKIWRSLEKVGEVKLIHSNDLTKEQWEKVFKDLATAESNSWVSEKGEPRFIGESNQYFWNQVVLDSWFSSSLNVWIIYLDGLPVSYALTIDTAQTRHVYAKGYDKKLHNHRTGTMLNFELINNAIAKHKKMINFGLGDSGHKTEWGAVKSDVLIDIVAFPKTIIGRILYFIAKITNKHLK